MSRLYSNNTALTALLPSITSRDTASLDPSSVFGSATVPVYPPTQLRVQLAAASPFPMDLYKQPLRTLSNTVLPKQESTPQRLLVSLWWHRPNAVSKRQAKKEILS